MWIYFIPHRPDPDTPLEETMALAHAVRAARRFTGHLELSAGGNHAAAKNCASWERRALITNPHYSMLIAG